MKKSNEFKLSLKIETINELQSAIIKGGLQTTGPVGTSVLSLRGTYDVDAGTTHVIICN